MIDSPVKVPRELNRKRRVRVVKCVPSQFSAFRRYEGTFHHVPRMGFWSGGKIKLKI